MQSATATKPCKLCGAERKRAANGRVLSIYCQECSERQRRAYDAKMQWCDSADPNHCRFFCEKCKEIKRQRQFESAKRGAETRRGRYPHRHVPVDAERFWQQVAMSMVAKAIRKGILPKLDGTIACVDCGGVASVYEHRDYGRPLDVVPTCQSCNHRRGTAIWPSSAHFQFARCVKGEKNLPASSLSTPLNKVANG